MAFTGVHIASGYVAGSRLRSGEIALANKPKWSQSFGLGPSGITSRTTPPFTVQDGAPTFEIRASVDIYVAIGANPDAGPSSGTDDSARIFVPAGVTRTLYCDSGDRLAWLQA